MPRLVAILLLLAVSTAGWAAGVYRWVDPEGNVHYGDRPQSADAEPVTLPGYRPTPRPGQPGRSGTEGGEQAGAGGYTALAIAQPQDGSTVRSNAGKVPLLVSIAPELQEGHYLEVRLDGTLVGTKQTLLVMELQQVIRGRHELQVSVFDAEGNLLRQSDPVRFYVLRSTLSEREGAEEDYQQWLTELQQEREAEIERERRERRERQLREQAEQRARIEALRRSDFEAKPGESGVFEGDKQGYPEVPTTRPGEQEKYREDSGTDLSAPTRPASSERRDELQIYDPADLPPQESGEPADYDPATAPKSGPITPYTGPGTNPTYAPTYTPPPAPAGN